MRAYNSGFVQYEPSGLVLEIASGLQPTQEADVLLEADESFIEPLRQRGYTVVLGDALNLPFKDGAFDFVTCLHLAEHFEEEEVRRLFDEMQRVAPRGFLEVPSIFWELMANCDDVLVPGGTIDGPHKQLCFYHDGVLHMIRKSDGFNREHKLLRSLFFNAVNADATASNVEIMMIGVPWEGAIKVQFHKSLSEVPDFLIDEMVRYMEQYGKARQKKTPLKFAVDAYAKSAKDKIRSIQDYHKQGKDKKKGVDIKSLLSS